MRSRTSRSRVDENVFKHYLYRQMNPAGVFFLTIILLATYPVNTMGQKHKFLNKRKEVLQNDTNFYFYHREIRHGVQSLMNPAYVIANNGFDILQLSGYTKIPAEMEWKANFRNLNHNLLHPIATIEAVGWKYFLQSEVFPLNFTPEGAQWVPNYFLHLLGTGMQYRMMTEWYRAHHVPAPKTWAILTMLAAQYLNEAVENKGFTGKNLDPIADWYLFNIGGILMFNSVKVSRFFSEKCHMADWGFMPGFSFRDFSIQNTGQWFIYKWFFRKHPQWGIFSRWGTGTYLGISRKIHNGHTITLSAGAKSDQYQLLDEVGKRSTVTLTWGVFMAWDKDNTPLMTLQLSGSEDATANLNIYPGVIRIKNFSPGIWVQAGRNQTGSFGICAQYTLGLGLGYGWK